MKRWKRFLVVIGNDGYSKKYEENNGNNDINGLWFASGQVVDVMV
jgi:hypothetical protein